MSAQLAQRWKSVTPGLSRPMRGLEPLSSQRASLAYLADNHAPGDACTSGCTQAACAQEALRGAWEALGRNLTDQVTIECSATLKVGP